VRRAIAVPQFGIALFLFAAAVYVFYRVGSDMISSDPATLGLKSPQVVRLGAAILTPFDEAPQKKPVKAEHYSDKERRTKVLVTFTAQKLLASDGKLVTDLSLVVPGPLKEKFEPQLSEIVGCPEGRPGPKARPKLEGEYAGKNVLVGVLNETRSASVKIPIPLEDFLTSSIRSNSETCEEKRADVINRRAKFRVPAELPVLAGPTRNYPSDYHQLSANVQIRLPKGFTLSGATQDEVSGLGSLPATLPDLTQVSSTPGMEGRTIAFLIPEASLPLSRSIDESRITAVTNVNTTVSPSDTQSDVPPQKHDVDLKLLVVRDSRTQGFAYAVAFLPLALMIALVSILFTHGREYNYTNITVHLAVATLSILPLRAVLVPSDLQGLTRIDYILVIQLLLIISMAFFLNGLQLWKPALRDDPKE
jgi:hypothetical protein